MSYQFLEVRVKNRIAIVEINRPPMNAANRKMYQEITSIFLEIGDRDDCDVVILTGKGKAFLAGNDLQEFIEMTPENAPEQMKIVREAFWAVYDCKIPVIAAVNGYALGSGFGFVSCCDIIIASEKAQFGLPEINVGVLGGAKFGSRILPEMVMRRMYFTGESMTAKEVASYGAISEITPPENLLNTAIAWAKKIATKSSVALKMAKESLNGSEFMNLKDGYEFEQGYTCKLSGDNESKEAVRAVMEKRKPIFKKK
ncbi:enoyl-CoA hydratase-related protein [Alkalihalobacterium elongatum]|uniref:enoyl-CoA hydratase-related protein n=1 Tax=Alkalihalobacterium elongatum TaxID=2675466 RepID=UPI001C1FEAD8|nr:enoyl-CoA hydratase-related protein [Alkalihalobacterium elongatum]